MDGRIAKKTVMSLFFFFLMLILAHFAIPSQVSRSFNVTSMNAGQYASVNLTVTITATEYVYLIEEKIPAGWTITDNGTGIRSVNDSTIIKWLYYNGSTPASNAILRYAVRSNTSSSGAYNFTGNYSFDSVNGTFLVLGQKQINVTVPDTTPPVRSKPLPNTTQPIGTISVNLNITTNEAATCKFDVSNLTYLSLANTFSATGGLSHRSTVTGLTPGQKIYYVRCQDTSGNQNTNEFLINFTILADTIPPVRSSLLPSGTIAAGTAKLNLSLKTDEAATCKYSNNPGISYAAMGETSYFNTVGGLNHSLEIDVAGGTSYLTYVRCSDGSGNANPDDANISFYVNSSDLTAPVISNIRPSGVLSAGTTSVEMGVSTDEAAVCRYSSSQSTPFSSMTAFTILNGGFNHTITLFGLANSTSYGYYVKCNDTKGNVNAAETLVNFSVASPTDPTAPVLISNTQPSGTLAAGTTSAVLSFTTDRNATCRYSTTAATAYGSMVSQITTASNTTHSTTIYGLSDGGSYTYYVRCNNTYGAVNTADTAISFSVAVVTTGGGGGGSGGGGGGGSSSGSSGSVSGIKVSSSGGGGGGAAQSDSNKKEIIWFDMKNNQNIISTIQEFLITKISFVNIGNDVDIARMTLTALDKAPGTIKSADNVYKYVAIRPQNVTPSNVKLTFKVSNKWLSSFDKSDVVLSRYSIAWDRLSTKYLSSDNDSTYYETTAPAIGYFAIMIDKEKALLKAKIQSPDAVLNDVVASESETSVENALDLGGNDRVLEEGKAEPGDNTQMIYLLSFAFLAGAVVFVVVQNSERIFGSFAKKAQSAEQSNANDMASQNMGGMGASSVNHIGSSSTYQSSQAATGTQASVSQPIAMYNPGVVEYIIKERALGISDAVLRQKLMSVGWPQNIIEECFKEVAKRTGR